MPIKINTLYVSKFFPGLAIKPLKFSRRDRKELLVNADWFQKDEKTNKWASMGINQDLVISTDAIGVEWKELY